MAPNSFRIQLALVCCIFLEMTLLAGEIPDNPDKAHAAAAATWEGNYKILKYKGREFIVGVREDAIKEFPLIGSRTMAESAFAEAVFSMTIESQDSYVIYDKTRKRFIVFNSAVCLKGKDASISEKTDWVGQIKPGGDHWEGDIVVFRKYDKKGAGMKAPYFSMGRDYPMTVADDGSSVVQYNYFGDIKFKLSTREVKDELLVQIVDSFDKNYHERTDEDKGR